MNAQIMITILAALAGLSMLLAAAAWVSRGRWTREIREHSEQVLRLKDDQIRKAEEQIRRLESLDSVRFTQRYIATKKGLEERIDRLSKQLAEVREKRHEAERQIQDLSLSAEERGSEVRRLQSDLLRTQHEVQRLEQIVEAVHRIGPIAIEEVKRELAQRRRLAAHIKGRLEHLTLQEDDKTEEIERLKAVIRTAREEVGRVMREIEITRSAGRIVDSMLGIDSEIQDRLAQHVGEHLEDALRRMSDTRERDPIAEFLEAVERGQKSRLLRAGVPQEPAVAAMPSRDDFTRAEPAMAADALHRPEVTVRPDGAAWAESMGDPDARPLRDDQPNGRPEEPRTAGSSFAVTD